MACGALLNFAACTFLLPHRLCLNTSSCMTVSGRHTFLTHYSQLTSHLGVSLRQAWYNALNDAQSSFRRFLTSSSSPEWKRVPVPRESTSLNSKGKGRSSVPELSDVVVHRKSTKSEDTVYRVILDVPTVDDTIPFEAWKSILATPELRQEWDPAVDGAVLLEMLDPTTRVSKTNFTLGWPAKCVCLHSSLSVRITDTIQSPRDAVTISRTFNDATTIIDVSTSLPRSPDEPAYLRPSPPYVRSNVKCEGLFRIDRIITLTTPVQYSHGVFSLSHRLRRRPPQTRLSEKPTLGAYVLLAFGSTISVQCGTSVPRAAFPNNWPPWFLVY